MWGKKTSSKKVTGHFDTLISSRTSVQGDMHFSGGLHIDGKVQGTLRADENGDAVVRISDVGEVDGDVIAPHIIVNGTVHGDVYASKHIELASKASIKGNVYYHLIEMAMGAEVNGKLVHHQDPSELPADIRSKVPGLKVASEKTTETIKNSGAKPAVVASAKVTDEKNAAPVKAQG
ncbi:MAG: polymer-forming cytoskeletal protein [Hahellaceae bacterium]|jgi:cytoskeletal protein CcmA (bactofilin family)|nr:polymer-forming cytoskeletal protein [Hahellaceae bacterium]MCP5210772.1 polymer-forming cytoskeletal protein [Hahellaceae bacterium]